MLQGGSRLKTTQLLGDLHNMFKALLSRAASYPKNNAEVPGSALHFHRVSEQSEQAEVGETETVYAKLILLDADGNAGGPLVVIGGGALIP